MMYNIYIYVYHNIHHDTLYMIYTYNLKHMIIYEILYIAMYMYISIDVYKYDNIYKYDDIYIYIICKW